MAVRYDRETGRFAIGFDPRKVTILKILSAIETLGGEKGRPYRPVEAEAMGWETLQALEPAAAQLQLF